MSVPASSRHPWGRGVSQVRRLAGIATRQHGAIAVSQLRQARISARQHRLLRNHSHDGLGGRARRRHDQRIPLLVGDPHDPRPGRGRRDATATGGSDRHCRPPRWRIRARTPVPGAHASRWPAAARDPGRAAPGRSACRACRFPLRQPRHRGRGDGSTGSGLPFLSLHRPDCALSHLGTSLTVDVAQHR